MPEPSSSETERAITWLRSIESMVENEELSEQAIIELIREVQDGLARSLETDVNESHLDYWERAINEVLNCDECDVCRSGTHSLKNVKKEIRRYPRTGKERDSDA